MSQEITALISVPSSVYSNNVLCLNPTQLIRCDANATQILNGVPFTSTQYARWAYAVNQDTDKIYFCNIENYLRSTDGFSLDAAVAGLPGGRYLDVFFDHLMVGYTYESGGLNKFRVRWSDLYDFNNFTVTSSNEADLYEFNEPEDETGFSRGITGMKRLGQGLAVYTPKTIYMVQYVGLPDVMRIEPVITGLGNAFPYAVVGVNRLHFFISDENFYVFDGASDPKPIGDDIKDYFFADLNKNQIIRDTLWAYHNSTMQEVHWVYANTSVNAAGTFNREVVYNYRENIWYVQSCENIHSFGYVGSLFRTIDQLTDVSSTIDGLTGQIDRLGQTNTNYDYAWGSDSNRVLQEEVTATLDVNLLSQTTPFLETGDMVYGSIEHVKEVDSICIHSEFSGCDGIKVEYSVRAHLDDPVVWQTAPQLWTPTLREGRLSFPRIAGRVFRFRFSPAMSSGASPVNLRKWNFTAWAENVYGERFTVEK